MCSIGGYPYSPKQSITPREKEKKRRKKIYTRILYKKTIIHAEDMTEQKGLTAVSREENKAEDG
jgi:hypothetical protein